MSTASSSITTAAGERQRLELADVFRRHGAEYRRSHFLPAEQQQAMTAIERCRTAALGGHLECCDRCGASRAVYHSCRNRHCPKCQSLAAGRWVEQQQARLLPVGYFHVVFTLPHELNPLASRHPRTIYALLFRAAAATLQEFAARHLRATLGITAVLHTWSQTLLHHPHVHCLVTGGGLALDGSAWIPSRSNFLFSVRALSLVFRGKFLDGLRRAERAGEIPAGCLTTAFVRRLHRHRWVIYCKRPFAGPEQVISYLGHYTHRIAISNQRLVRLDQDRLAFRWRDRAHDDLPRVMEIDVAEFIRRFLQHVLPKGFTRLRHFGLHANRARAKLARCRESLGQPAPSPPDPAPVADVVLRLTGHDLLKCPQCQLGRMRRVAELLPGRPAPVGFFLPPDTS